GWYPRAPRELPMPNACVAAVLLALSLQDAPALPPHAAADLITRTGERSGSPGQPAPASRARGARAARSPGGSPGPIRRAAAGAMPRLLAHQGALRSLCTSTYLSAVGDLALFAREDFGMEMALIVSGSSLVSCYQLARVAQRLAADRAASLATLVEMLSSN